MAHAETCPVCGGTGKKPDPKCMDDSYAKCHGCDGKGWVEVGNDNIPVPYPVPVPTPAPSPWQPAPYEPEWPPRPMITWHYQYEVGS